MEIIRFLSPKKEGKFYNVNKFSNVVKIFILNKDIKKEFIIKFIGKRSKIYTKNFNFAEFNTCKMVYAIYSLLLLLPSLPGSPKDFGTINYLIINASGGLWSNNNKE